MLIQLIMNNDRDGQDTCLTIWAKTEYKGDYCNDRYTNNRLHCDFV